MLQMVKECSWQQLAVDPDKSLLENGFFGLCLHNQMLKLLLTQ